jgi:predicted ATPase
MMCSGWARAQLGDFEVGAAELRQALASYRNQGNGLWVPIFRGLLAEIEARDQGVEAAVTRIDEALAFAGEIGEHWTDAFLHRIRGEILLKSDPTSTARAEEAFLNALSVAQQQKARSFELQAATSLARIWRDQGKVQQGRELLAPIYGWFTEGFDTRDLKEAKALLDKLTT